MESLRVKSKNSFVSSCLPARIFSKVGLLSTSFVMLLASARKTLETVQKSCRGVGDLGPVVQTPVSLSLFHLSQKPTGKLAASAFKYCDWMKVLAAGLRVGFCDEWRRAFIARFPLGDDIFFRANKQKANVIGWCCFQCSSPANQVALFSVRANKFA